VGKKGMKIIYQFQVVVAFSTGFCTISTWFSQGQY
jgi:flagellar basal body-associated protein FliL